MKTFSAAIAFTISWPGRFTSSINLLLSDATNEYLFLSSHVNVSSRTSRMILRRSGTRVFTFRLAFAATMPVNGSAPAP